MYYHKINESKMSTILVEEAKSSKVYNFASPVHIFVEKVTIQHKNTPR